MAGQDTKDIAVNDGGRLMEGKAGDGGGGIVADTFQSAEPLCRSRKTATLNDLLGGGMQMASTTIVAQSLPLAQYLVLGGCCQRIDCRPSLHETLPIG